MIAGDELAQEWRDGMKRAGGAAFGAGLVAVLCAGWAVLAWSTGFGGELFIQPGGFIAEWVLPTGTPSETFQTRSANSAEEAFAQLVVTRALQSGLRAWWCAVAFWVAAVPALTFLGIFTMRRHGS